MPAAARCTPPVTGASSVATPALGGQRGEALQLVQVVGAHVDPGAAGGETREDAVRAGDDRARRPRARAGR